MKKTTFPFNRSDQTGSASAAVNFGTMNAATHARAGTQRKHNIHNE